VVGPFFEGEPPEPGEDRDLFLGWEGVAKDECRISSGLQDVDTRLGGLSGGNGLVDEGVSPHEAFCKFVGFPDCCNLA